MTTTPKKDGKPFDTKGKYVRISLAAYEKIWAEAQKCGVSFIKAADKLVNV